MVNESAGSKGGVRCQRWFVRLGAGQNYRRAPAGRVGARTSLGRGPSFGAEGPRRRAGFGCARFFGDCNTARKEHSQAAVAVTCHVLPRRCRSVVRLFSPVLVLILMGLVPGRVAVFDFRVHEYGGPRQNELFSGGSTSSELFCTKEDAQDDGFKIPRPRRNP
jgi:hypothetical protein